VKRPRSPSPTQGYHPGYGYKHAAVSGYSQPSERLNAQIRIKSNYHFLQKWRKDEEGMNILEQFYGTVSYILMKI
jgi:hypothetical protein